MGGSQRQIGSRLLVLIMMEQILGPITVACRILLLFNWKFATIYAKYNVP